MLKLAKIIRIITISPVIAFLLCTTLLVFRNDTFIGWYDYLITIFCLCILPVLAYPIERKFHIIKGDTRKGERSLAVIFSVIGYIIALTLAFILKTPRLEKVLLLTYFISGVMIAIYSFIFKDNACGHMCGLTGPIAMLVYLYGWCFLFLGIIMIAVIWSTLKLKRHNIHQIIVGSIIPIIALIVSIGNVEYTTTGATINLNGMLPSYEVLPVDYQPLATFNSTSTVDTNLRVIMSVSCVDSDSNMVDMSTLGYTDLLGFGNNSAIKIVAAGWNLNTNDITINSDHSETFIFYYFGSNQTETTITSGNNSIPFLTSMIFNGDIVGMEAEGMTFTFSFAFQAKQTNYINWNELNTIQFTTGIE